MFDIGGQELILILIAVLVFFGPKKLPELAQSFGKGLREFRRAQREFTDQINSAFEEEHRKSRSVPSPANAVPRQMTAPQPVFPTVDPDQDRPAALATPPVSTEQPASQTAPSVAEPAKPSGDELII